MRHLNDINEKLKNEDYLNKLEKEGVKVDSLRKNLKRKQDDTSQGVSK